MADPSNLTGGDAFAWVGASFNLDDFKIKFKLAKQFFDEPISTVARYAQSIHKTHKPNFIGLETNNTGKNVLFLFHQKYNMTYIHGVSTSANLTEKTRSKGYAMDKPFMVHWFQEKLENHDIVFPGNPSPDMQELIDQIPKISEFKSAGGQTSYRAYRGQHDDLFMAALHCCNFIRLFIEQQKELA